MLTTTETAKRLGITRQAVHGLIQRGTLIGARVGFRDWGVDEQSVEDRLLMLADKERAPERQEKERRERRTAECRQG